MPFTLPFSPDTIGWHRTALVELRKLGIDLQQGPEDAEVRRPFGHWDSTLPPFMAST
jgi:hypothetical protein